MTLERIMPYSYGNNVNSSNPQPKATTSAVQGANPYRGGYSGASGPKFRGQPTKDVVEISAGNEIKGKKKTGLSKGVKWLLGIAGTAATIYGGVVLHRQINKPSIEKVAKNFSEIFRKEVSADDAQKMVNRYKEIFEIKDADNFCTKMFEQVKKDYGYSDVGIKLKIEKMADTSVASKFSKADVAAYSAMDGVLQLNPVHFKDGTMSLGDKQQMFEAIIHELQHAKQSE